MQFATLSDKEIKQRYDIAKKYFAELGVDTDAALKTLAATPISLHCWQGDDVHGFEVHDTAVTGGGIMSTGNYPGCATQAKSASTSTQSTPKPTASPSNAMKSPRNTSRTG